MTGLILAVLLGGVGPVPLTAALTLDAKTEQPTGEVSSPGWNVADDDLKTAWKADGRRLLVTFPAAFVVALEVRLAPSKGRAKGNVSVRARPTLAPTDGGQAELGEWMTFEVPREEILTLDVPKAGIWVGLELELAWTSPVTRTDPVLVASLFVESSREPMCPKAQVWKPTSDILGHALTATPSGPTSLDLDRCTAELGGRTVSGLCARGKKGVTTARFEQTVVTVKEFGCALATVNGSPWQRVFP